MENAKLKIEIEKYQKTGVWSDEMHDMATGLATIVFKHKFTDDYDEWIQNCYVVLMGAAKRVDINRDLFAYLYTCLINMGRSSYTKQKLIVKKLEEYSKFHVSRT